LATGSKKQRSKEAKKQRMKIVKPFGVKVSYHPIKKKYKATTNSDHNKPLYKNELEQNFTTEQPNRVFFGDISYI
jgi:putative transposase